jgi:hypothetical protein
MRDSTRSWKKCVPKERSGSILLLPEAISISSEVLQMSA